MRKSSKTFVLSDETMNLYGFIVDTDGIDLADFLQNPVMLYNHDYTKLIGQWAEVRKENGKLLGVPMFDEEDPEAMKYYNKVEQGILKAASVGLTPVKFDDVNKRMVKSSLKEASPTPVGANRKALVLYDGDGKSLSGDKAIEYCLSLQQQSEQQTQNDQMNKKFITALVALSAQVGLTVNLSDAASEDDALDAIKKVGEKVTVLKASETNLTAELAALNKEKKDAAAKEHNDLLKNAVDEKLLSAEQAEGLKTVELPALKIALSAMKPASVVTVETGKTTVATDANDPRKDWTYDDYALKAPQELEKMEVSEPKKFEALLSAKVAKVRGEHSITV